MTKTDGAVEFDRLLAEEDLILAATELVAEAMERRNVTRKELAALLGVSQGEVTQRMSGSRNLTLRSLADMLHVLGAHASVAVTFDDEPAEVREEAGERSHQSWVMTSTVPWDDTFPSVGDPHFAKLFETMRLESPTFIAGQAIGAHAELQYVAPVIPLGNYRSLRLREDQVDRAG